jgi:hypothetical protein
MSKNKRKILFAVIIAIVSTFTMTAFQAYAVNETGISNIQYSYEGIPEEKAEQIVKSIYGIPDDMIQPFSLLCLFGHSIQTGSITTTEHNYYSTAPRCRETVSYVDYCTRSGCDYFVIKSTYYGRTGCH